MTNPLIYNVWNMAYIACEASLVDLAFYTGSASSIGQKVLRIV